MEIRKAGESDAAGIIQVMQNAEASGYMLFDPGERSMSAESFARFIQSVHANPKSAVFVAIEQQNIVGYLLVQNETPKRISHRAYIVVGVHSESRGTGVGKALFLHAVSWAKQAALHRLDLTVMTENDAAVALYKKMGFDIEGVKRASLVVEGTYKDEYYMSKLI